MSAVRYPTVLKTSTFSIKDCEKHFQYVCYLSNSTTKLKIISETNNTSRDIAQNITTFFNVGLVIVKRSEVKNFAPFFVPRIGLARAKPCYKLRSQN